MASNESESSASASRDTASPAHSFQTDTPGAGTESSPTHVDRVDLKNPALYINRELSWLEFNERVLNEARDSSNPLLERVKFLGIVATNLDEFVMIRVSTMVKKARAGIRDVSPDGLDNTTDQLAAMRSRARQMLLDQNACWAQLRQELAAEQIVFVEPEAWTAGMHKYLQRHFSRDIALVLTPFAFDPGHPFPYISNLSKNFAVVVRQGGRTKFARVTLPDALPRFCPPAGHACRHARQYFRVSRGCNPRKHARSVSRHPSGWRASISNHSRDRSRNRRGMRPTLCSSRLTAA